MDRRLQPRPRKRSPDRRAGFTLIEVVAVMLIIALVASLAVTMMPGTGRGGLKALTLEAAALLRRLQPIRELSGNTDARRRAPS